MFEGIAPFSPLHHADGNSERNTCVCLGVCVCGCVGVCVCGCVGVWVCEESVLLIDVRHPICSQCMSLLFK